MNITWNDIRGLYARLTPADKKSFIDRLKSMQDNADSSTPQLSSYRGENQNKT